MLNYGQQVFLSRPCEPLRHIKLQQGQAAVHRRIMLKSRAAELQSRLSQIGTWEISMCRRRVREWSTSPSLQVQMPESANAVWLVGALMQSGPDPEGEQAI
jgi:hypothetical protein